MAITRGATITNWFDVDIDFTEAEKIYITYKQSGRTVLEKTLEDCVITPKRIEVSFSQSETLKFRENADVEIQIRVKMPDESAHVSEIINTTTTKLLKEGVI